MSAIARNVASTSRVCGEGRAERASAHLRARGRQHARVLPHLHGRQVEAERLDLPAQVLQLAPRQPRRAAGLERPLQRLDVGQEGSPGPRRRRGRRRGSRPAGARPDPASADAARRAACDPSSVATSGSASASRSSARRSARLGGTSRSETDSVRAIRRAAASMPAQRVVGLDRHRGPRDLGRDGRVAVAIAAHPGAPSQERLERRLGRAPQRSGSSGGPPLGRSPGSVTKIVWSNRASIARTSSSGSGRCRRIGSVRQRPGDLLAQASMDLLLVGGAESAGPRAVPAAHRSATGARPPPDASPRSGGRSAPG